MLHANTGEKQEADSYIESCIFSMHQVIVMQVDPGSHVEKQCFRNEHSAWVAF